MASRSWTELFFLDEAVALAAGHRPLLSLQTRGCRAVSGLLGGRKRRAAPFGQAIDSVLHHKRIERATASASIRSRGRWPNSPRARWSSQQDRPLPSIPDERIDGRIRAMPTGATSPRWWLADTALDADGARLRLSAGAPSVDQRCLRLAPCPISLNSLRYLVLPQEIVLAFRGILSWPGPLSV
jgi:hypothetical protein